MQRSAEFYEQVFGWTTRRRGDGAVAFDDATGEVSGTWTLGRPASPTPGLLLYIMVDDAVATVASIELTAAPSCSRSAETHPRSRRGSADPGGNVLGIYQEPAL